MKLAAASFALLVSVSGLAAIYLISDRHRDASDSIQIDESKSLCTPATSSAGRTDCLEQPDRADVSDQRREADRQDEPESGGLPARIEKLRENTVQFAERFNAIADESAKNRAKAAQLEARIAHLELELDQCTNGSMSVLATLRALPDWTTLDTTQQRTVNAFLERFPVHLLPGEATMIATHTSPTGDTTRELIRMLGQERVRATLSADAQAAMQHDDPEEWAEYFGGR